MRYPLGHSFRHLLHNLLKRSLAVEPFGIGEVGTYRALSKPCAINSGVTAVVPVEASAGGVLGVVAFSGVL
jgi:hypothetical protein